MAVTKAGAFRMDRQTGPSFRLESSEFLRCGLHGECDIAALVYRPGENPDKILSSFLYDLRNSGHNAIGLLQRRRPHLQDARETVEFYLIPATDNDGSCVEKQGSITKSSDSQLQRLCGRLLQSLDGRPDIVVLNRFGSLEACGLGLIEVFSKAIGQDVPVLIAVPDALFRDWLKVVQGLAVKLPCCRGDLDRWWEGVQPAAAKTAANPNFCERFK
jgi:hypothetical protein